jgi:hypothetical protein
VVTADELRSSGSLEPDSTERRARFIAGIDLGTTNSAMCYIDTDESPTRIRTFGIPQVTAHGIVERRDTLPSFHYEALPEEVQAGVLRLPWLTENLRTTVGVFARDHGRTAPGRMIESAKSWLCHNAVDRRAALLPWHGAADIERLSPVEVSARYLGHLRAAWDAEHPDEPLSQQDVILTIPASFDEVARELTVAASRLAGLPRIVLIEEPQAAFYSWVDAHQQNWDQQVSPGQKILVCDIGGGTSDFSLIHVRAGDSGRLQFHRVAVGDHLLLGGDNLDLAIAHHVEQRMVQAGLAPSAGLSPRQWSALIPACRHGKETLLGEGNPERHTIVIPGSGSRLIGGSLQLEVTRDEILQIIIDGFLPEVSLTEKPQRRQSGFQEFGLPYAADPGITRYLAAFLTAHASGIQSASGTSAEPEGPGLAESMARPDILLFNGGFFASPTLRERLIECLKNWFRRTSPDWSPVILKNDRLDLAVARGAASFGMVRRGQGVKIVAGLARTYYVGVEQQDHSIAALCLIAAGTEATDQSHEIEREFAVRTSEPVEFPILVSGTRLIDQPGSLVPVDPEQMTALPPIRTVLSTRRKGAGETVRARISVRMTEIGTLELWCRQLDSDRRWQLQFDVRSATETDRAAHQGAAETSGIVDEHLIQAGAAVIRRAFAAGSRETPDGLPRRIADAVGLSRHEWPPSLLRGLWAELMEQEDCRRRSAHLESRWLNLAGYCLRPGFGMAADDWRVEETWKTLKGRLVFGGAASLTEWRILCRRIAGGLTAARQAHLATTLLPAIRQKHRQLVSGRGKAADYASGSHEAAEIWRMLGSLELLSPAVRSELGNMAADFLSMSATAAIHPALIWALGRLGARVPVYGPLNLVLPVTDIERWIEALLDYPDSENTIVQLSLMQLSRRTSDRYRDVSEDLRERVLSFLRQSGAEAHLMVLVRDGGVLDSEEAGRIIGEALPAGLKIC